MYLPSVEELLSSCDEVVNSILLSLLGEADVLVCGCCPIHSKTVSNMSVTSIGAVTIPDDEYVCEHRRYFNCWVSQVLVAGEVEDRN